VEHRNRANPEVRLILSDQEFLNGFTFSTQPGNCGEHPYGQPMSKTHIPGLLDVHLDLRIMRYTQLKIVRFSLRMFALYVLFFILMLKMTQMRVETFIVA